MKNHPLFQQDIRLVTGSKVLEDANYIRSYKETLGAFQRLSHKASERAFPFLESPFDPAPAEKYRELVTHFQQFRMIVVIGVAEELAGARALSALLQSWVWVEDSFPRLCFLDQLDPETFWEMMSVANPQTTGVIVISQSGDSLPTLIQLMRCLEYWQGLIAPQDFHQHFLIITGQKAGNLRKIITHFHLTHISYPESTGKAVSCFSVVALLIAMIVGLDIHKLCQGAALTCNQFFLRHLRTPIEGVALMRTLVQFHGVQNHFLLPHGDIFDPLIAWYQQIWAEVLGEKSEFLFPIRNKPFEKLMPFGKIRYFFTVFSELQVARERLMPELWAGFPELKKLSCTALADLSQAQCEKMCQLLVSRKHPLRILRVHTLNEETLGALLMNSLLETLLVAELLAAP